MGVNGEVKGNLMREKLAARQYSQAKLPLMVPSIKHHKICTQLYSFTALTLKG